MLIDTSLPHKLDERVGLLGEMLCVKSPSVTAGRAHVRRFMDEGLPPGTMDVVVCTRRLQHFPRRHNYGEAINALLSVMATSRQVTNKLKGMTPHILESRCARCFNAVEEMFAFYAITRIDEVAAPLTSIETLVLEREVPLHTWSYLCHSLFEKKLFEQKRFVAVDERVAKTPEEHRYAPCVSIDRDRIRLDSVPVHGDKSQIFFMAGRLM